MATVTIDIPGIGTVEAENAASESTLRELVAIMKKGQGSGGGGGGNAQAKNTKQIEENTEAQEKFEDRVKKGVTSMIKFADGLTGLVKQFANVGDSLESAADVFGGIPIIGTMFSAVAGAATKVTDSFVKATSSGATFSGSVVEMARSAGQAGMTLEQFGNFLASNGASLVALGGETDAGARRFSQISKEIRATGQELFALGYSTQDINEGLANYTKQLRMQGLSSKMSNQELVQGSKKYLKEMDLLAKITGEERKAKEAERERLLKDAQFQASMIGLQEDVRKSFLDTVQGLPAGLQDFSKDILAAGTATTEENQKLLAFLPETANLLNQYREKMQRGEALTLEERNRLNNLMRSEAEKNADQIKTAGTYSAEFAGVTNAMTEALQMQTDGVTKAANAQGKAIAETDGMNQSMQQTKAALASFSNEFMLALSGSGILPVLIQAFTTAANLVMTYVVPAFQFMAGIISDYVWPALSTFADMVVSGVGYLKGLLDSVGATEGVLKTLGVVAGIVTGAYIIQAIVNGILAASTTVVAVAMGALAIGATIVSTVLGVLAAAASLVSLPFVAIAAVVIGLAYGFKKLYDSGWTLGSAFDAMIDNIKLFGMNIMEFIDNMRAKLPEWAGGLSESEKEERAKLREEAREDLKLREIMRDGQRASIAAERNKKDEEEKTAKEDKKQSAEDAKLTQQSLNLKKDELKTAKEIKSAKDYNTLDSVSLLKSEMEGRKTIENQADQQAKKTQEAKKLEEGKTSVSTETPGVTASTGTAKTQDSTSSLLASLNSKMDQLIRVAGDQLNVQKGLSNDLYNA